MFKRYIAISFLIYVSPSYVRSEEFYRNPALTRKLADSLSTSPEYLIPNIPPRAQGLPGTVYNSVRMRPVRVEERDDKDLMEGAEAGIDASDAFSSSENAGTSSVLWFKIAEDASELATTSLILPDAHSIEMTEDKLLEKLQSSLDVRHACERGEQLLVVTKSYEGIPNITLNIKSQADAEAFTRIKAKLAEAHLNINVYEGAKIIYKLDKKIIFAFEVSKIQCDLEGLKNNKGGIRIAKISNTEFAKIDSSGNTLVQIKKPFTIGGAPMYPANNIVENAVNSKTHTTLVAAVKAAGLVDTLESAGPFTVFAPTNKAFSKLPKGTVETLNMPENKDKLTAILKYHVIAGTLTAKGLMAEIKAGGGKVELKTVQGEILTAKMAGKVITLTDAKGDVAHITIADVMQSNGVIHVIDTVLLPAG